MGFFCAGNSVVSLSFLLTISNVNKFFPNNSKTTNKNNNNNNNDDNNNSRIDETNFSLSCSLPPLTNRPSSLCLQFPYHLGGLGNRVPQFADNSGALSICNQAIHPKPQLTVGTSEFCVKKLQILHAIFANSAQHFNTFLLWYNCL